MSARTFPYDEEQVAQVAEKYGISLPQARAKIYSWANSKKYYEAHKEERKAYYSAYKKMKRDYIRGPYAKRNTER